uniref:Secreted protein n=1 Tax=Fagus sylvatica TaxID=28930 RepID=A0A2N9FP41_FAGSY
MLCSCSLLPNFLLLLSPICPHEAMDLSPPEGALLCSLLPNFLLLLSPICPHEAMDLSPPKVFPLLKFERFGV